MDKPMTTIDTVTDEQIQALWDEARAAGDRAMATTCGWAAYGLDWARIKCVEAINAAEAMDDEE